MKAGSIMFVLPIIIINCNSIYGAVISKLINCGKGTIICKSSWAQSPLNKIFALLCLLELISYDNEHLSRMI